MSFPNTWNPMEYDYHHAPFNKYTLGLGGEVDDKVQPAGAVAIGSVSKSSTQLVGDGQKIDENYQQQRELYSLYVKQIPKEFDDDRNLALKNLCSNYGRVLRVRSISAGPNKFVDFNSLADMERALSALQHNKYGMVFEPAKRNPINNNHSGQSLMAQSQQKPSLQKDNNNSTIDMSRRTFKGPFTNPSRPDLSKYQNDLVDNKCYEHINLQKADPKKEFLIAKDMHSHERNTNNPLQELQHLAGNKENVTAICGTGYRGVYTGRGYFIESQEVIEKHRKQAAASEGYFDKSKGVFIKLAKNPALNSIKAGSCLLCKEPCVQVCERCRGFYCSVECQKKDFPEHRYICFELPQLVVKGSNTIGKGDAPTREPGSQQVEAQSDIDTLKRQQLPISSTVCVTEDTIDWEKPTTSVSYGSALSKSNVTYSTFKTFPEPDKKSVENQKEKKVEPRNPADKHLIPLGMFPKSGSVAAITAIAKTNLVFIRSLESKAKVEYVKILNIINCHGINAKSVAKMPIPGDVLITDFQGSGYFRILVLNPKSEEEIVVVYIDFGNIDKKKLNDLKDLPEPCWGLPRQALACFLQGVPEFEPNNGVKKYMFSFVRNLGKDLKIVYKEQNRAELIDVATNENINRKILQLREVSAPEMMNTAPVFNNEIEVKMLPQLENVPVIVLDNSLIGIGYICCVHKDDAVEIESLNKKLADYAEKTKEPYTPRETEICVALYDQNKQWYRAECIETVGDGYPTLIFIDYGNMLPVAIENIRPYPRKLIQPCYTIQCSISGLPKEITDDLAKRLQELLPVNFETSLDSVKAEQNEDFNIIEIKSLIKTLKTEGLI